MSPEEIKELRKKLECTAKELATTLGLEQDTVLAWERGDLFPTKRYVSQMQALEAKGKGAIARKPRKNARPTTPMAVLADPETWKLIRKLCTNAELRREAQKLAEAYPDPADEPEGT